MHFYAVIIGSEILNGRRVDKHFDFLKAVLLERGHTLYASFIIKDDAELIADTYRMIRKDPDSVMFSFGGIGSTPDDLTRDVAAAVFTGRPTVRHPDFEAAILERFGEQAYPYRIHMADLPEGADLLKNPVNNMSGFFLEARFFFVPGFPEMAHAMVHEALSRFYPAGADSFRRTLLAHTSENHLIDVMKTMPPGIECSALPMIREGKPFVEISVAGHDARAVDDAFARFELYLREAGFAYRELKNQASR